MCTEILHGHIPCADKFSEYSDTHEDYPDFMERDSGI